jgi:hypothetical protein
MNKKLFWAFVLVALLTLVTVISVAAVSGAAFTTFNAHVDGASKDVCKNSAINCNIYGAKEYVWLNGGPTANGLGPDGQYFFAVLVPGGQPNPNDGGIKNLSDDYDCYLNREFTVKDGEVSVYSGYKCTGYPFQDKHWLDSGKGAKGPNGAPPYIRLFPYADTTNPGGVYIMAICSLQDGYPVDPRDCKYDAFKVKKGKMDYSFYLSGMKFEDKYADGVKDTGDMGLEGWKILISGTGPDGLPFSATATTDANGFWEWYSPVYTFTGTQKPVDVTVTVCEELKTGWTQSYPGGNGCHTFTFTPTGFDSFFDLDFGNWYPVDVTACKVRDLDGEPGGDTVPVPGWPVSLTKDGTVLDNQFTGEDGCYTWTEYPVGTPLKPGYSYDVHEGSKTGWESLGPVDFVFPRAKSGESFSHTFVNAVLEGCTPGFWQGGSAGGQAGGQWLWNEVQDPQWAASGGMGWNPYIWTTGFNSFFAPYGGLNGFDMMGLVGTGGGADDFQKAGRDVVAAYLNASWGMNYPYTPAQISQMWADAVASGDFMSLHLTLDAANNSGADTNGDGMLEHQCPISASGY